MYLKKEDTDFYSSRHLKYNVKTTAINKCWFIKFLDDKVEVWN